jgi:hypothetical protein
MWIIGNIKPDQKPFKEVDKLAKQASATPLTGPEPTLGIPKYLAREAIRTWTIDQHYRHWRDVPRHKHGKLFIRGPCKKRAEDLLKLSRHQLNGGGDSHRTCSCENAPTYYGPVWGWSCLQTLRTASWNSAAHHLSLRSDGLMFWGTRLSNPKLNGQLQSGTFASSSEA